MDEDGDGNDECLASLDTVNPRQNIDGVGAEYSEHAHVQIVQRTWGEVSTEGRSSMGHTASACSKRAFVVSSQLSRCGRLPFAYNPVTPANACSRTLSG